MKIHLILMVLFLSVIALPTELNLPVRPDTQQKLTFALQRLLQQLEYFRTPFENRSNLYKRVAQTEQYLQEVTSQVGEYDSIVRGRANTIGGRNNIIVGSFNTIRGSNNYVFIEKYKGQANGDLLLGKWRIEIEKKTLILINSGFAISFINEETNRRYLRYLTESRQFSLGSSLGDAVVTVVREEDVTGGAAGFSFGATGQGVVGQISNSGLTGGRNMGQQESSLPMIRSQGLPSSSISIPIIPTASVIATRQTILTPSPKPTQPTRITRPTQSIPSNSPTSITNTPSKSSESSSINRRINMEQALAARDFQSSNNVQPRQVTDMFSPNRLQLSQPGSNLRTEQAQTIIQSQSSTQAPFAQPDQRTSLGSRIIQSPSQSQSQTIPTSSLVPTQQRISPSPYTQQQPSNQMPIINLATWRNRA